MSRGFILSIYKYERDSTDNDIEHSNASIKRKIESELFGNKDIQIPDNFLSTFTEEELPENFVDYDGLIEYKLLDRKNHKVYRKLLDYDFNSDWCELRDRLGVNIYSVDREYIKLDSNIIDKLVVAIDYILNENYDRKMEFVLDNEFIDIIGDSYSLYLKQSCNGSYSEELLCNTQIKDERYGLERLKTALNSFRYTDTENLILIATGW